MDYYVHYPMPKNGQLFKLYSDAVQTIRKYRLQATITRIQKDNGECCFKLTMKETK